MGYSKLQFKQIKGIHRYTFISFSKELYEKSISEVQGSRSVSPSTLQTRLHVYLLKGFQQINSIPFTYPHWILKKILSTQYSVKLQINETRIQEKTQGED